MSRIALLRHGFYTIARAASKPRGSSLFDSLDVAFPNTAGRIRMFSTENSQRAYPFYEMLPNPEKRQAIEDINAFADSLRRRVDSLRFDGHHKAEMEPDGKFSGRAGLVANYHQAALALEGKLLLEKPAPNRVCFDGKVEIFCLESDYEKAKGALVIAKMGDAVVGRMFMSQNGEHHLTFLSVSNLPTLNKAKIDDQDLQKEILLAYFEDRGLNAKQFEEMRQSRLRTSCIADYKYTLIHMANKARVLEKNPMFSFEARDDDELEYGFDKTLETAAVKTETSRSNLMDLVGARYKPAKNPASAAALALQRPKQTTHD